MQSPIRWLMHNPRLSHASCWNRVPETHVATSAQKTCFAVFWKKLGNYVGYESCQKHQASSPLYKCYAGHGSNAGLRWRWRKGTIANLLEKLYDQRRGFISSIMQAMGPQYGHLIWHPYPIWFVWPSVWTPNLDPNTYQGYITYQILIMVLPGEDRAYQPSPCLVVSG